MLLTNLSQCPVNYLLHLLFESLPVGAEFKFLLDWIIANSHINPRHRPESFLILLIEIAYLFNCMAEMAYHVDN